jgi:hypothetical protein
MTFRCGCKCEDTNKGGKMKQWVTSVLLVIMFLAFLLFAWSLTPAAYGAERAVAVSNGELWKHVDIVDGKTVVCYWPKNTESGVADDIITGIACVVLDPAPDPVVVYKCYDENHDHPQYKYRNEDLF